MVLSSLAGEEMCKVPGGKQPWELKKGEGIRLFNERRVTCVYIYIYIYPEQPFFLADDW